MSEVEMYEAQGRAHARAKRLRSEIATARAELSRVGKSMEHISRCVSNVAHDPASIRDQLSLTSELTVRLRIKDASLFRDTANIIEELEMKASELSELQVQIDNF